MIVPENLTTINIDRLNFDFIWIGVALKDPVENADLLTTSEPNILTNKTNFQTLLDIWNECHAWFSLDPEEVPTHCIEDLRELADNLIPFEPFPGFEKIVTADELIKVKEMRHALDQRLSDTNPENVDDDEPAQLNPEPEKDTALIIEGLMPAPLEVAPQQGEEEKSSPTGVTITADDSMPKPPPPTTDILKQCVLDALESIKDNSEKYQQAQASQSRFRRLLPRKSDISTIDEEMGKLRLALNILNETFDRIDDPKVLEAFRGPLAQIDVSLKILADQNIKYKTIYLDGQAKEHLNQIASDRYFQATIMAIKEGTADHTDAVAMGVGFVALEDSVKLLEELFARLDESFNLPSPDMAKNKAVSNISTFFQTLIKRDPKHILILSDRMLDHYKSILSQIDYDPPRDSKTLEYVIQQTIKNSIESNPDALNILREENKAKIMKITGLDDQGYDQMHKTVQQLAQDKASKKPKPKQDKPPDEFLREVSPWTHRILTADVNLDEYAKEVSKSFSIHLGNMTANIQFEDLRDTRWSKESEHPISVLAREYTQISDLISRDILNANTPEQQAMMYKFYIEVGKQAIERGDFNTAYAIRGGLGQAPVNRLHLVHGLLRQEGIDPDKPFMVTIDGKQQSLFDPTRKYKNYRDYMQIYQQSESAKKQGHYLNPIPVLPFILNELQLCMEGNEGNVAAQIETSRKILLQLKETQTTLRTTDLGNFTAANNVYLQHHLPKAKKMVNELDAHSKSVFAKEISGNDRLFGQVQRGLYGKKSLHQAVLNAVSNNNFQDSKLIQAKLIRVQKILKQEPALTEEEKQAVLEHLFKHTSLAQHGGAVLSEHPTTVNGKLWASLQQQYKPKPKVEPQNTLEVDKVEQKIPKNQPQQWVQANVPKRAKVTTGPLAAKHQTDNKPPRTKVDSDKPVDQIKKNRKNTKAFVFLMEAIENEENYNQQLDSALLSAQAYLAASAEKTPNSPAVQLVEALKEAKAGAAQGLQRYGQLRNHLENNYGELIKGENSWYKQLSHIEKKQLPEKIIKLNNASNALLEQLQGKDLSAFGNLKLGRLGPMDINLKHMEALEDFLNTQTAILKDIDPEAKQALLDEIKSTKELLQAKRNLAVQVSGEIEKITKDPVFLQFVKDVGKESRPYMQHCVPMIHLCSYIQYTDNNHYAVMNSVNNDIKFNQQVSAIMQRPSRLDMPLKEAYTELFETGLVENGSELQQAYEFTLQSLVQWNLEIDQIILEDDYGLVGKDKLNFGLDEFTQSTKEPLEILKEKIKGLEGELANEKVKLENAIDANDQISILGCQRRINQKQALIKEYTSKFQDPDNKENVKQSFIDYTEEIKEIRDNYRGKGEIKQLETKLQAVYKAYIALDKAQILLNSSPAGSPKMFKQQKVLDKAYQNFLDAQAKITPNEQKIILLYMQAGVGDLEIYSRLQSRADLSTIDAVLQKAHDFENKGRIYRMPTAIEKQHATELAKVRSNIPDDGLLVPINALCKHLGIQQHYDHQSVLDGLQALDDALNKKDFFEFPKAQQNQLKEVIAGVKSLRENKITRNNYLAHSKQQYKYIDLIEQIIQSKSPEQDYHQTALGIVYCGVGPGKEFDLAYFMKYMAKTHQENENARSHIEQFISTLLETDANIYYVIQSIDEAQSQSNKQKPAQEKEVTILNHMGQIFSGDPEKSLILAGKIASAKPINKAQTPDSIQGPKAKQALNNFSSQSSPWLENLGDAYDSRVQAVTELLMYQNLADYHQLTPSDFADVNFSKLSPGHVKTKIENSTRISNMIVRDILAAKDEQARTQVYQFYLDVGYKALEQNDFETVVQINTALSNAAITRLAYTHRHIDRPNFDPYNPIVAEQNGVIVNIAASDKNYTHMRQHMATNPDARPFFGMISTDLTFAKDGNTGNSPKMIELSGPIINMIMQIKRQHPLTKPNISPDYSQYLDEMLQYQLPEKTSSADPIVDHLFERSLATEARAYSGEVSSIYKAIHELTNITAGKSVEALLSNKQLNIDLSRIQGKIRAVDDLETRASLYRFLVENSAYARTSGKVLSSDPTSLNGKLFKQLQSENRSVNRRYRIYQRINHMTKAIRSLPKRFTRNKREAAISASSTTATKPQHQGQPSTTTNTGEISNVTETADISPTVSTPKKDATTNTWKSASPDKSRAKIRRQPVARSESTGQSAVHYQNQPTTEESPESLASDSTAMGPSAPPQEQEEASSALRHRLSQAGQALGHSAAPPLEPERPRDARLQRVESELITDQSPKQVAEKFIRHLSSIKSPQAALTEVRMAANKTDQEVYRKDTEQGEYKKSFEVKQGKQGRVVLRSETNPQDKDVLLMAKMIVSSGIKEPLIRQGSAKQLIALQQELTKFNIKPRLSEEVVIKLQQKASTEEKTTLEGLYNVRLQEERASAPPLIPQPENEGGDTPKPSVDRTTPTNK